MLRLFELQRICCLTLGLVFIGSYAYAEMSAPDILESVLAVERDRPPVMMDLDIFQNYAHEKDEKNGRYYYVQFRQKGEVFDIIDKSFLPQDDGTLQELSNSRLIWDGKKFLYRRQKVGYNLKARLATKSKNMESIAWRSHAPYLYGVLDYGTQHYAELLLESSNLKIRSEQEEVDGALCYVVEGNTSNGHFTVWIDANNGFRYRKAIVLNKYDPPLDMGSGQAIVSRTSEISGVKIDSIEGVPVITKSSKVVHNLYSDGRVEDDVLEAKRLNVKWNPNFEAVGAFEMDIPDGTRVAHMDFQGKGVKFQWLNGEVVTMLEDDALEAIDEAVAQLASTKPVTTDTKPEASPEKSTSIANKQTNNLSAEQEISTKSVRPGMVAKQKTTSKLFSFFKWVLILLGVLVLVTVSYLMFNLHRRSNHAEV